MPAHALTIDLEDWHQLLYRRFTGALGTPTEGTVRATHRLLDALDRAGVKATFFTVGVLAERFPELVREVHRRGHEIGSHSFTHRLIHRLTPDEFREEMRRALGQLEQLVGVKVRGFRAPEFSVQALGHWCFEVLAELGLEYDSSVFPIASARYGIAGAPRAPFRMETKSGPLWEFPLATWAVGRSLLPIAGGSYFRLWPAAVMNRALRDLDAMESGSVFYFHPYEFSDVTLRLGELPLRTRLHPSYLKYRVLHNLRTANILRKLEPALRRLEFRPLGEICSGLQAAATRNLH